MHIHKILKTRLADDALFDCVDPGDLAAIDFILTIKAALGEASINSFKAGRSNCQAFQTMMRPARMAAASSAKRKFGPPISENVMPMAAAAEVMASAR